MNIKLYIMKLFVILAYNKAGYPIGPFYVVASNFTKAKKALKEQESGWIGKMKLNHIQPVLITQ